MSKLPDLYVVGKALCKGVWNRSPINSFTHDSLVAFGKTVGLKPVRPSFYQLYNSASGMLQPKNVARVVARSVYRHVYPRSTFVYFERA